jgi:drug/metabolite transporter (DMT)-like permease
VSSVAALFQMIPVFGFILAFFILGENLSSLQIVASLFIIIGAVIITLDINDGFPKIKSDVFMLMMLSAFLLAVSSVIFKFFAIEDRFLTTTFWEYVGLTVSAFLLLMVKPYREEFLRVISENKISFVGINFLNELLNISGRILITFAAMFAPVALVMVINGFMPLFLLIIGIIITIFFPFLGEESLRKRHLAQKFTAVVIMFIGVFLLNK